SRLSSVAQCAAQAREEPPLHRPYARPQHEPGWPEHDELSDELHRGRTRPGDPSGQRTAGPRPLVVDVDAALDLAVAGLPEVHLDPVRGRLRGERPDHAVETPDDLPGIG